MVPIPAMHTSYYEQTLHSSALELKYAQSTHLVDIITKDEDIRRLRFDIHILEDDKDELRELLQQEEDRSDAFVKLVNENLARAEEAEANLQDLETDLRQREQECQTLRAEKNALQHSSEDASAALTEKLALTRELSQVKPELEHLKAQAASTAALISEKLALQHQLSGIQCELEDAKREARRAMAKRRNTGVEIAQEVQMDELRRKLEKETRLRQLAEEVADAVQGDGPADDIRKQLTKERRARREAEEQLAAAQETTQVEDVRNDLLHEKKAKAKLEKSLKNLQAELEREKKATEVVPGSAQADGEAEKLRQELTLEKERAKAEKAARQAADEYEAQKATLEDKLSQFREKLKTTKVQLKETQTELEAAQEAAAKKAVASAKAPAKASTAAKANPKKRSAAQLDQDAATLGTPGDGPAAKRSRRGASGVGDKSTFSITPFLNKTTSVIQEEDEDSDAEGASPAAKGATPRQPLAQQPASQSNVPLKKPVAQRKPKAQPALEMVTEESESQQDQEPAARKPTKEQGLKIKTKTTDGPDKPAEPNKKKPKMRKSLADFATFNLEPEVEKKKRKLGGLGKTLFDEEVEEGAPARAALPGAKGLFGSKGFAALGAAAKKKGGLGSSFLGGSSRPGTTLLTAVDGSGFQFSPLKKARRNLDDTLRG